MERDVPDYTRDHDIKPTDTWGTPGGSGNMPTDKGGSDRGSSGRDDNDDDDR